METGHVPVLRAGVLDPASTTTAPVFLHEEHYADLVAYGLKTSLPRFSNSCTNVSCLPKSMASWQERIRQRLSDDRDTTGSHAASILRQRPLLRDCSVVGSSGSLLMHRQGRLIDAAQAVFRVNDARVRGFEDFSGSRTTFRLWAQVPRAMDGEAEVPGLPLVYCPPVYWLGKCFYAIASEDRPYPRLSPRLWQEVRASVRTAANRTARGTYPTTGALAIWIAVRLCERVRIFGFGNGTWNCVPPGRAVCSKYWVLPSKNLRTHSCDPWWGYDNYVRKQGWHDLLAEGAWIEAMLRAGTIEAPPCTLPPRSR